MAEGVEVSINQNGDIVKFKAGQGGEEVGQALVKHKNGKVVIADIGVPVEHRGRGVASRLTDEIVKHAEESGASEIGALAAPEYANILERKGFSLNGLFASLKLKKR